jgi:riboflavin kinase / FMN adenylyltransferase
MQKSAVTIGNFDGIHAGHRHLFRQVVSAARQSGLRPAAVTFDPHPMCVVAPERAPRLLTTIEERRALIREQGIEEVVVLPFTTEMARLTPEHFAQRILAELLGAGLVLVGRNFRFGYKQAGDARILTELGKRFEYETQIVDVVKCRGRFVSSSDVRRLIETGDVAMAARLLERPHSLSGDVVSGHGIGSKQTVPTLNLRTSDEVLPGNGVYISRTRDLETGTRWNSITNIGFRPTFSGDAMTIETFLLDPLVGEPPKRIRVEFLRYVREERKFESPEALKTQILRDVGRAQTFFRRLARWTQAH